MKVYDRNLTGATTGEASRSQESQKADRENLRTSSAQGSSADRVEFSSTLGTLARAVSADQASHAERIAALTAQVQSGTYRPDAMAISRGMVSAALAQT
jgi:flagellar biosynthesis anti-sigma factor FlgM